MEMKITILFHQTVAIWEIPWLIHGGLVREDKPEDFPQLYPVRPRTQHRA